MDSDERAMVAEMQEQIATLQAQVEQLQQRQTLLLKHLYLCIKFDWTVAKTYQKGNDWMARFKAAGEQLSACLTKYQ